ncbi:MAG: hypothetical protein JJV98_04040 [Desulfosarcina sp.]|nr:hypothetical protein [Desulfobacterales bacterium]
MSDNKLKEQIIEELKKAQETGQITTEKVHDIVSAAVSAAVSETDGSYNEVRAAVNEAVGAAVEGLTAAGVDPKETLEGAIVGAVAGACKSGDQTVEATREEIQQLKNRLEDETARLAQILREGLEGVKEAGAVLSEDVRKRVEDTVAHVKLNSTELLGLTRQTVKEAVKQTIESGKDVKEIVTRIASDATEKALKEGRFTVKRVKKITEKVLSGAIEAAEETGKEVKDVTAGAFEGAQKGILSAIESAENRTKSFLGEDSARAKEEPVFIDDLFIETTRTVARRSGEEAMKLLNDLADQAGKTTSVLREKSHSVAETVAERLKQAGKDTAKAADVMAEEAKELGKRTVAVAKATMAAMWQGTREAFKKGNKGD